MNRHINIVLPNRQFNIDGFENKPIDTITNIVNFSIDIIFCSVLNKVPKESVNSIISTLTNKLRPGGQIIFVFNDIRGISKLFADGSIANEDFLLLMNDTKNLYFLGEFEEFFNQNLLSDFIVLNTELKNNAIHISIQRKIV